MPVFAEGSTTNIPAHNEEAMPCVAATADILSDPEVCWVSLLSSAGCTTLMVDCASGFIDCALGGDDLRIALPSITNTSVSHGGARANHWVCLPCTLVCSQLTLANKLYCTVQYIRKTLDSNPGSLQFRGFWRNRTHQMLWIQRDSSCGLHGIFLDTFQNGEMNA
jgi:hypothetical protein